MEKHYLRLFYDFLQLQGKWESFKQNRRSFRIADVPFIPEISINNPKTWLTYSFPWYMNSEVEHQQWLSLNKEWDKTIMNQVKLNALNIKRTEWTHQGYYRLTKYWKTIIKEYENRTN